MPFRSQFDDFIIEFHSNSATHGYNHRLAFKHLLACLKVLDYVACNVLYPAGTADECFQLCPFGLGFLNIVHIFHLQLFVQLLHQFASFGTQFYLG